ncbi:MAG TPA: 2TM domain-containing protein [Ideonella sp.]|nr:2TM domain-containing protein [Ideonella sp.]
MPSTPDTAPDTTDDELMQRAKRRVGMKLGFYTHALVFVLVNLGLFFINNLSGGYRWSFFPLWGWGLALTIHGVVTFIGLSGDGLRERMLADEVQRLRRQG